MWECVPLTANIVLVLPSWLPTIGTTAPAIYADFTTEGTSNHYWYRNAQYGSAAAWLTAVSGTFARSSTAYYTNASGLLASASNDVLRFDYDPVALTPRGILMEQSSTNLALRSRDLTNVVWLKVNGTAALDQTGADGNATSASSFTATAGNATALQSITLGSGTDTFSVYLKRITGTGEVDITIDNGGTWVNVTSLINSATYTRVNTNESIINPIFGIRLVTNGDKVAVDFNQLEAFSYATSPILTTTATVTRAGEVLRVTPISPWYNPTMGVLFAAGDSVSNTGSNNFAVINDDSINNFWQMTAASFVSGNSLTQVLSGGVNQFFVTTSGYGSGFLANTLGKEATSVAANNFAYCKDGGTVSTQASGVTPVSPAFFDIGSSQNTDTTEPNGHVAQVGYWPVTATNAQLQTLTT